MEMFLFKLEACCPLERCGETSETEVTIPMASAFKRAVYTILAKKNRRRNVSCIIVFMVDARMDLLYVCEGVGKCRKCRRNLNNLL
jgi:hypothetical protein